MGRRNGKGGGERRIGGREVEGDGKEERKRRDGQGGREGERGGEEGREGGRERERERKGTDI